MGSFSIIFFFPKFMTHVRKTSLKLVSFQRNDGSRSREDPRAPSTACYYSSGEDESSGDDRDTPPPPPGETVAGEILVAAGCKGCFMCFTVLRRVDACPNYSGNLLHLGRNGSF